MIACLPTLLVLDWGLAGGDGGWVLSGSLGQWEYGNTAIAGYSGPVWGTRLGGPTLNDAVELLELPVPPLAGAARPVLVLDHHHDLGLGDSARVEVDDGGGFQPVAPIHGTPAGLAFLGASAGFHEVGFDLSGFGDAPRVRLRFEADAAGSGPGWFVRGARVVDGDPIPPRLEVLASPADTQDLDGPYRVEIAVTEDVGVRSASLAWSDGIGGGQVALLPDGDRWVGGLPPVPAGRTVSWTATVDDCASSVSVSGDPFRVFLAGPTGLFGPIEPHTVARSVTLEWTAPVSPHPVQGYELEELGTGALTAATDARADVALDPESQDFVVRAIYEVGRSDPSEVLSLDVEVPELYAVDPPFAWAGDRAWVEVRGHSLYLLDGLSALALGEGVTVESFDVRDVNRGLALVSIDPAAPTGPRSVSVSGAQGVFAFDAAFTVLDAADAPRIVSVEPSGIVQGDERVVELRANRTFAGPLTVITDDEIVHTDPLSVQGEQVRLGLAVTGRARPGPHTIVLDDGARLWSAEIEVLEYRVPARRVCGVAGGEAAGLLVGLGALSARRRGTTGRRPPGGRSARS